jgi:enterochelin esterase-like enzyme
MGGLMSLFAISRYNQWFSKAACVSSATMFCFSKLVQELSACTLDSNTRVYLSWGTQEAFGLLNKTKPDCTSVTYRQNQKAAKLLKKAGADVKLVCQVNGKHCEADWEKQNKRYMNYLWK